MALPNVGPVASANVSRAVEPQKSFGKVFEQQKKPNASGAAPQQPASEVAPKPVVPSRAVARAGVSQAVQGPQKAQAQAAVKMVDQLSAAQLRLDRILKLAESGKTFTPAELLGMQAQVSQASQQLDLAGKVVDKATSGVKQILQTQV